MKNEGKLDIIRPFGPAVAQTTIPKILIDKINNFVDEVIKDKKRSKELDFGKKLAGEVTQEIFLPNEILQGEILKADSMSSEVMTTLPLEGMVPLCKG